MPGSALVRKNTTVRLRRTASACAWRTPFCSASATLRTRVFRIHVRKSGAARNNNKAKMLIVTISSTIVMPRWRHWRLLSMARPSS